MSAKFALVARLAAAAGTAPLLGGNGDGRKSVALGGHQRGDSYPSTALTQISAGRDYTHDGPDGLDGPRWQFDHRARSPEEAEALARATVLEMETAADVADGLGGTWRFHPAQLESEEGPFDDGEQDGGQPLFRVMQDFMFYFEEID